MHDFHLSQQFGMTTHSYECLFVAANLAVFHKSWGFTIKILHWKKFLEEHHFITSNSIGSFEVDTKKLTYMPSSMEQNLQRLGSRFT